MRLMRPARLPRTSGRPHLIVLLLAMSGLLFSGDVLQAQQRFLNLRSAELAGRRVRIDEGRWMSVSGILKSTDPGSDGLWLPYAASKGARPRVSVHPPLSGELQIEVVETPAVLGESWSLVPLPFSAWGVGSLSELGQNGRRRGRRNPTRPELLR